ncbi:hypothetical protein BZA77DRAFT_349594 [Pyronema omphalodes]|nr:hypothetical protein BZA77DRAFT_349594 [Pyronema omphalodes]
MLLGSFHRAFSLFQHNSPSLDYRKHFPTVVEPPLVAHISDSKGNEIVTTAGNQQQSASLQKLSCAFLEAHELALKMGLGAPLRVTLETKKGLTVMHTAHTESQGSSEAVVGTVVAPEGKMADARVASRKVEACAAKVAKVLVDERF